MKAAKVIKINMKKDKLNTHDSDWQVKITFLLFCYVT